MNQNVYLFVSKHVLPICPVVFPYTRIPITILAAENRVPTISGTRNYARKFVGNYHQKIEFVCMALVIGTLGMVEVQLMSAHSNPRVSAGPVNRAEVHPTGSLH